MGLKSALMGLKGTKMYEKDLRRGRTAPCAVRRIRRSEDELVRVGAVMEMASSVRGLGLCVSLAGGSVAGIFSRSIDRTVDHL